MGINVDSNTGAKTIACDASGKQFVVGVDEVAVTPIDLPHRPRRWVCNDALPAFLDAVDKLLSGKPEPKSKLASKE